MNVLMFGVMTASRVHGNIQSQGVMMSCYQPDGNHGQVWGEGKISTWAMLVLCQETLSKLSHLLHVGVIPCS
jgi:hypothetical protein